MGLKPGDDVVVALEGDEVRILTVAQSIRRAQVIVRRYVPEGTSLSEDLLEERRQEAARG